MSGDLLSQALALIESFDETQLTALAESLGLDARPPAAELRERLRAYVTAAAPCVPAAPIDEKATRARFKALSPRQLAKVRALFGLEPSDDTPAQIACSLTNYLLPPVGAEARSQSNAARKRKPSA